MKFIVLRVWILDVVFMIMASAIMAAVGLGIYAWRTNLLIADYQERHAQHVQYEDILARDCLVQEQLALAYSGVAARFVKELGLSGGALGLFIAEHQKAMKRASMPGSGIGGN
jgi:hypothetical protein